MVNRDEDAGSGEVWPLVVVGAGAAGLMAAIVAARAGARTLLLETRPRPGAKIRVSGGGRCNVLPSQAAVDDFRTSGSTKALRNVLLSWPLAEVRRFFEADLGIGLKTEASGKVFPRSDQSRDVVEALLRAAAAAGVVLRGERRVVDLAPVVGGAFVLRCEGGEELRAARVVLATGGLSLPKTGSDGGGLALARRLGHRLVPDYPALVPLRTSDPGWTTLAGVSTRVALEVWSGDQRIDRATGDLLFTHRGFSGPVVLDLGHHFARAFREESRRSMEVAPGRVRSDHTAGAGGTGLTLRAGFLPGEASWAEVLDRPGKGLVGPTVRERLPRRLADLLLARAAVPAEARLAELPRAARSRLLEVLERCDLAIEGDEGYRTAEVTGGGVPLDEVSPSTLESRLVPGLYLAGELLDVFGRLGGFNFLWAWVSGRVAGRAAARLAG